MAGKADPSTPTTKTPKIIRAIKIPFNTSQNFLPPLLVSGHVTDVVVQNPAGNSNPITVEGVSVSPGGAWTWSIPGPDFELDPTGITIDVQGQPVVIYYNYYRRLRRASLGVSAALHNLFI